MTNLVGLTVMHSLRESNFIQLSESITTLTSVYIKELQVPSDMAYAFCDHTLLRSLRLPSNVKEIVEQNDDDIDYPMLCNLRDLELANWPWKDKKFQRYLTNLTGLVILNSPIEEDEANALIELTQLEKLIMTGSDYNDKLSILTNITELGVAALTNSLITMPNLSKISSLFLDAHSSELLTAFVNLTALHTNGEYSIVFFYKSLIGCNGRCTRQRIPFG